MITNLHLYQGTFKFESRILKETTSLIKTNLVDQIIVITFWDKGMKQEDLVNKRIKIIRMKTILSFNANKMKMFYKILMMIEWYFRVFNYVYKANIKVIHCHSLETLPLSVLLKLLNKSKLVYDAHELETEKYGINGIIKILYKYLEKIMIGYADDVIVVGNCIAKWYKKQYPIKQIHIIKNLPIKMNRNKKYQDMLRKKLDINSKEVIFIYQGILEVGRGIEILLDAFSKVKGKHIVFMGYGGLERKICSFNKKYSNIHLIPAVELKDIYKYTSGADVGISLIENNCLSNYYSLPNKIYEYLSCGLPILTSNLPETKILAEKYGWKIPPNRSELVRLVNQINKLTLKNKKVLINKNKSDFYWENEEYKLLSIYKKLLAE